ncbi:MarC family protein [Cyanobium sp. Maggiore-St4-Cus]|jgi:multiple antibiotic resistance protein|uniref:MarC family protein n=1 Tax=Cyanobium sp. Maggiore-St4-Cus TaxID=2823717 RepID=UPI0020CCFE24|nr:MarC family protein [Cyanobium sp. Maggiore-St4-Cus]MCP9788110.1 MarC family protein [Cyanobium sp. Maggiore-St4-Cus]
MSLSTLAVGLLALSDPLGLLSVVGQAGAGSDSRLRRISRLAVLTYLAVLLVACWWGSGLLGLFGISLPAFRIAGGLILLPLGLRLLEGRPALLASPLADDPAAAIVPIGVPLMAGPGTISLVVAEAPDAWSGRLLVSLVIGAMAVGLYLFLQLTPRLRGWLGQTRERVLQRLMGLLITAVAVQILVNGLKGCFPILA